MTALLRLIQLAVAALVAAAGGGLALGLLFILSSAAAWVTVHGAGGLVSDLPSLVLATMLIVAITTGGAVASAWLPAFAAGTALWAAGRAWPWARRRLAWAGVGAAVSLLLYWSWAPPGLHGRSMFDSIGLPRAAATALFILAGAAAGRLFRSTLAAAAAFLGLDEWKPDEAG